MSTVQDGVGFRWFAYDAFGRELSETVTGLVNYVLTRTWETNGLGQVGGRYKGYALGVDHDVTYGYDTFGRIDGVHAIVGTSQPDVVASYTYKPGTDLLATKSVGTPTSTVLFTTHAYDAMGAITQLVNVAGTTILNRAYTLDPLQRRTKMTQPDGSWWDYGYDDKSQLATASRRFPSGNEHLFYGYRWDEIGNPIATDRRNGPVAWTVSNTCNSLNQIVQMNTAPYVEIFGEADPDAQVTMNGLPALRDNRTFHGVVPVSNRFSAVTAEVAVVATMNLGGTSSDQVATSVVQKIVFRDAAMFVHDEDGNQRLGDQSEYRWDAENRLIEVDHRGVTTTNTYDYRARHAAYGEGGGHVAFIYDGWNEVANGGSVQEVVVRGLDLSRSTQGAGGVGGILACVTSQRLCAPVADAGGNIDTLVAFSGEIARQFEYDAFGGPIGESGTQDSWFQYSSKRAVHSDSLTYFGRRYYSARMQRWLSSDPLGYSGGYNLYGFVDNDPVNRWDPLGLYPCTYHIDAEPRAESGNGGVHGETRLPMWSYTVSDSCRSSGSCSFSIHYWYLEGGWPRDQFNFSPRSHEEHHVDIWRDNFERFVHEASNYSLCDRCDESSECYRDLIEIELRDYWFLVAEYQNDRFDWDAYGEKDFLAGEESKVTPESLSFRLRALAEGLARLQSKRLRCDALR